MLKFDTRIVPSSRTLLMAATIILTITLCGPSAAWSSFVQRRSQGVLLKMTYEAGQAVSAGGCQSMGGGSAAFGSGSAAAGGGGGSALARIERNALAGLSPSLMSVSL